MHHRTDDPDHPRHGDHREPESREPVFTTMAVGEEGDPDLHPDPAHSPGEPVFTTMAVGEEGDADPLPDAIGFPEEPVFTTLAVGEEGADVEFDWPAFTTFAVGEESDGGFDDPWCA